MSYPKCAHKLCHAESVGQAKIVDPAIDTLLWSGDVCHEHLHSLMKVIDEDQPMRALVANFETALPN